MTPWRSPWGPGGVLRPGHLCPFCGGLGAHLRSASQHPYFLDCQPCLGAGTTPLVPPTIAISRKQHKFLRKLEDRG